MGACAVLDQPPLSSWSVPLREDANFLNLGARTVDSPLAASELYEAIPDKIAGWLAEPERIRSVQLTNADYFDRFVDPVRVGAYILDSVQESGLESV
jgi:hypothetical protein